MVKTSEVLQELQTISRAIDKVMRITGFKEYGDMSCLEINEENADDTFLRNEMERIIDKLADEQSRINFLFRPIIETGNIYQNSSGRYETASGYEYTCGYDIEYLKLAEDEYEPTQWCRSRVEHNGESYYIVGDKKMSLDGLTVRIRGKH
ncbi:DUF5348 domain-containing protein [Anaerotignum sp.]|uniref:DUF5348 domain-containing protein n=1 Tax=Anaerotignum sp. TaxID=2039241 RepID=UPI0028B15BFD|nr:DUF5348 domain-containing protein [Anaerotignum sp.]